MKKQIVFIHGGSAYSKYESYLEHLRSVPLERVLPSNARRWPETLELESLGADWEVLAPKMPNAQNARYIEWKIWFERLFEMLAGDVVLVGWSQGGYFLVRYLTENVFPCSIKALYLIATPFALESWDGEDGGDFGFDPDLLPNIQEMAHNILIFHSTDDFVVPYGQALKYQEALPLATLVTFEGRGHFLQETFPELIEHIRGLK